MDPMSKSGKRKERTAKSDSSLNSNPEQESVPENEEGWRWPLADRPLSVEEFAERAAVLRREIRSSISTTEIIRAHRDGKSIP